MKGLSLLNTRASPLYRADSSANRAIEFQKRCTMSHPFHHHHHGPGSNSLVKEIIHEMIRPHHGPPPPPLPYHHYDPPPPPPHHHYGPPPPPPPHHHYGPPPHHFHGPPPPPPHHHHGPPHHFHGPPPPCGHHSQFYGCSHCDGVLDKGIGTNWEELKCARIEVSSILAILDGLGLMPLPSMARITAVGVNLVLAGWTTMWRQWRIQTPKKQLKKNVGNLGSDLVTIASLCNANIQW
ncbi:hypothetical protein HUJ04_007643 [Dendroctonus ponderosae]|nr:hypothetical protein HUJ04_007643 [Dendroctonus ponderosae]